MSSSLPDSEANDIQTVGQLAYITGIQIHEIKQNSLNLEQKTLKTEEIVGKLRDQILKYEYTEKELRTQIEAAKFNQEKNYEAIQKLKEIDLKQQTQIKMISFIAGIFGTLFIVFLGVYLDKNL